MRNLVYSRPAVYTFEHSKTGLVSLDQGYDARVPVTAAGIDVNSLSFLARTHELRPTTSQVFVRFMNLSTRELLALSGDDSTVPSMTVTDEMLCRSRCVHVL
jgi:hypothetical protein